MKMAGVRVCGCVFAVSYCCFMLLAVAQITDPWEVTALRAVKRSLHDPMKHLRNWKKGDPCTSNWTGVICFDVDKNDGYLHVKELQLLNKNLSGSLAPELGQLSHLEILDFMWNEITDSVPKEIGNITSLKLLLLNGNKLSGPLPEELGYLSNLDRLQVDQNNISGPIPKSFGHLSKLKHLHMNNNSISGQIPSELSNLSIMLHVLLDSNHLSGYLPPEFSNLPELRILQLDNNNFEGTEVPGSYGNLSKLAKLSLRNCSLHGAVPDLSRIPQLSYLDLSFNRLSGSIPSNKLSDNITTIDLSENYLNGSIPRNFSDLPRLQRLSLENNFLTGSIPASIWNKSFNTTTRLKLDLRNNKLANILGDLNPPPIVTLSLQGNPICKNGNIQNIGQFCGSKAGGDGMPESSTNSTLVCSYYSCPADDFFEYVSPYEYNSAFPVPCFCALPLRIGYRLKSPSFSHFSPYVQPFEMYLTRSLNLSLYQLSIDSIVWEEGPRLRMYLKLLPMFNSLILLFNTSEIQRIRGRFTSWDFPPNDFFGPYELLNFTLMGNYSNDFIPTKRNRTGLIVGVVIAVGAVCFLSVFVVYYFVERRKRQHTNDNEELLGIGSTPYTFNYAELRTATEDFNPANKLGEGGFGPVYKGTINDGRVVAVKQLSVASHQGKDQFETEIATISAVQHRNLVKLYGCCIEGDKRLLVYEYLENKSLDQALFGKGSLDLNWSTRSDICLGIARGLSYLHEESRLRIVHRDVKASNILLDSNLKPKISDFGLAKLYDDSKTHISTRVAGTIGYLAPEYAMRGHLTEKADVFGFGVVALEIVSGRSNSDSSLGEEKMYLLEWAWHLYENNRQIELVDTKISDFNEEEVKRMIRIALLCTQTSPMLRPPMSRVVGMLSGDIEVTSVTSKPNYLTDWKFNDATGSRAEPEIFLRGVKTFE